MSLDGAPVPPPELQIYNSYVIDPQYARYFTIAWTSTLAAFAVLNSPSLVRAVYRRRVPSPKGLWENAYAYQPVGEDEGKSRLDRLDSGPPPALNQSPHTRLIALVASVIQTVSLRSLRRIRIDLGQTVLLAGATIAAILCLTQAAELRSNSNRAGFMALSLLTPTFLFASKNSPAALLLGKGYEKLNWVHRWAGRLLFLMATVHGSLWINNRIRNGKEELLHTGIKETRGMAAYGTLCMIVLLSLRPVRSYAYQFFYLSHTLGYITFFIVICYHTPYAQPWIFPPIAFWGLDLVLRLSRFRFKDAYLTPVDQQMTLVRIPDIQGGWVAGQHVRLRVFFGGRPFESHPLTILNADSATTALPQSSPTSTGITLGVRAVGDWSSDLHRLAGEHPSGEDVRVGVMLDGPYGGLSLDLGDFESILLVAGGSGATFTLGVLDDIVGRIVRHGRAKGEKTRLIKYVWFIKSYGCISWFAPIFAHLAEACHGTSLSLSFQFYVTCLCDPSNLIGIRNSTVAESKPMIEELFAPLLQHNADPEKTTPSSITGGVAVAASGPETLLSAAMAEDLNAILASSRGLVAHLPRPDLPSINLSLDQIEAQSRRLVSKQPVAPSTSGKATYLLAGGNVDANAHADLVANLNTVATFAPLTQLHDADVSGYLRHSHEQTIISCIEEGRRETEQEFYRVLDERVRRDWEVRKKKIFDELGKFNVGDNTRGGSSLRASALGRTVRGATTGVVSQPATSLSMFNKMMAYDKIIRGLNQARLAGTAYPVVSALIQTAQTYAESAPSIAPTLELLRHMVAEPPSLTLPSSHSQAHILNTPLLERRYARAHLGNQDAPAAAELRTNIANGARVGLEKQYLEFVDATIQRDPANAAIGGDPSVSNRIMGYLRCAFYRGGRWDEDLELLRGRPVWAHIFYLVRTGHLREALDVANESADALERSEQYFLSYLKAWVESSDRRLPKILRDRLQTTYNSHILHSPNADPFKVALFKLIGRLDPSRRAVRRATNTAEDWIWFQLAMVDEDEGNGLRELGRVLEGYGEKHFEGGGAAKRGMWARVLMVCGLFEQAIAALYENPDHRIEAVHIAVALAYYGLLRVPSTSESSQVDILTAIPFQPSALNLALLITRYVKPFMTSDPKEAIQYAYCVSLSHDQGQNVGKEQVDYARELTRRIIVAAPAGWDDLVGGLRPDGTRYSGVVEHDMHLLHIKSPEEYRDVIVLPAAQLCEQDQKPIAAIRLYNLAGKTNIVLGCLSRALGDSLSDVNSSGEEAKQLEASAREILTHYERRGETLDQNQVRIIRKLLKARQAISLSATGDLEGALAALDNPDLLPLDAETSTIARRAEEFRDQDDPLTHNIGQLLLLAMSILHQIYTQAKSAQYGDIGKQSTLNIVKKKTRALISFAGMLKYRLSADIFGQLTRMSVTVLH
ncbi:nucleoporin-interacting protein NIC96 [Ceratobasidium sp. AG-Ba]|nr:nucleoporin-interacting protein NIC96 [Ceratobasidium sp. AG-Ba]